jgi:nicotinamide mononucleotide transporter
MSWIEIAGVAFGLLSVGLTVRASAWCWPTGIANSLLFLVMFANAKLYADAALQVVYVIVSVYGWWYWLRPVPGVAEVPITRTPRVESAILLTLAVASAFAWGALLASRTDAALPYWNSLTVAASLAAQWLLSRKRVENWLVWIGADVVMIAVYAWTGLRLTAALYVVFLLMSIAGWREWSATMGPAASRPG